MSEIKINIRQSGTLPGTSKWLADQVANAEFKFGKTKYGEFAILAKFAGAEKFKVLAFVRNPDDMDAILYFYEWNEKWAVQLACPNDEDYNDHRPTVFDQQMTSGARVSYYNMIRALIAKAEHIIDADPVVELNVTVTDPSLSDKSNRVPQHHSAARKQRFYEQVSNLIDSNPEYSCSAEEIANKYWFSGETCGLDMGEMIAIAEFALHEKSTTNE